MRNGKEGKRGILVGFSSCSSGTRGESCTHILLWGLELPCVSSVCTPRLRTATSSLLDASPIPRQIQVRRCCFEKRKRRLEGFEEWKCVVLRLEMNRSKLHFEGLKRKCVQVFVI
jgi:hypothetical protein